MHNFHTQTCTVQHVCPSVEDTSLVVLDGLVEVETVEVERHRGNTKCGEPDTDNRPCCEEEVQRTGVVEGSVLEDQATEVTVSGDDVVGLFFLTELVTIVLGLGFSSFTNERRRNQRTVHRREQRPTKDTCDSKHVERVHEDVVLCLEDQHVVERTRDAERHSVRERTLTEWIDEEHCRSSGDRRRVSNTDPWAHTQTIGQFPFTTHVCIDTDQEVEDDKLERTTVVKHSFIEGCCFPNRIEVKSNCVGRGTTAPEMMLLP